ncbi:hypothetical protein D0867_09026 [Hortaea werneckii]|uniref:Kynurenine formamidase n=1 Tax=Hortaea werneckii TaxID=91943 RepID=A0A3M6Z075_HORWE|nr:hypothetical protein KC355_g1296 [Hortaea werneckii]RMY08462.1 hypothetical protein D0867_09026 [Hortaea werneckii]RMY28468.1 hypothetical protein D0866_09395 [Hortaea werneckii]
MDTTEGFPQSRQNVKYSNHSALNTLDYYIPRRPSTADHQLWIIYIHGGAWRDPEIDSTSFTQAQNLLLQSREIDQIAGFASINYRLSPYPSHPHSPSNPSDPARNAHHPDHLNDILDALRHLQDTFSFGTRYLLVGHSCGATLAFQVAMMQHQHQQPSKSPPPLALLAVEGLYDLPALVAYHSDSPIYSHLITNAFGPNPSDWARASPSSGISSASSHQHQAEAWPNLIVLAHSRQDELVEWQQVDLMHAALKSRGFDEVGGEDGGGGRLKLVELNGGHDEVWRQGEELARAVGETLQVVRGWGGV